MSEFQRWIVRFVGLVVVVAVIYVVAVLIPHDNPAVLAAVSSVLAYISWLLGKLFEKPLDSVTVATASQMSPANAAQMIVKLASSPPPQLRQIMESMRPLPNNVVLQFRDTEPAPPLDDTQH